MTWTRWSCLILLAGFLAAQPPLELKGLRGGRPVSASGQYAGRRRSGSRRHIVVQFKQQPSRAALQLLRQREASIRGTFLSLDMFCPRPMASFWPIWICSGLAR